MDKKPVPFFAKKADNNEVVVKTGVRAGLAEPKMKLKEEQEKSR